MCLWSIMTFELRTVSVVYWQVSVVGATEPQLACRCRPRWRHLKAPPPWSRSLDKFVPDSTWLWRPLTPDPRRSLTVTRRGPGACHQLCVNGSAALTHRANTPSLSRSARRPPLAQELRGHGFRFRLISMQLSLSDLKLKDNVDTLKGARSHSFVHNVPKIQVICCIFNFWQSIPPLRRNKRSSRIHAVITITKCKLTIQY